MNIGTSTQGTIIASLAVTFQHNIDDTGRALWRIFRGRVINDLDTLDALRGNLLQDLRTVICRQTARLTIDPHLHTAVSTERDLTIRRHLHTRDILQQITCGTSCRR